MAHPRGRESAVQPHAAHHRSQARHAVLAVALAELFQIGTIVAVGNVAHRSLLRSGQEVPKVRHPSHGGRSGFKRGLAELLDAGLGG